MIHTRQNHRAVNWPRLGFIGAVGLLLAGCQLLSHEQREQPDILREGAHLESIHCGRCHEHVPPEDLSPAAWVAVVRDMGRRAHMTPLESEKVLAWLQWANPRTPQEREAMVAKTGK